MAITPKQEKILEYISKYIDENWFSPTIIEIQFAFWFKSIHSVTQILNALEKKGSIYRWAWFRSIKLASNVWFQLTFNIPILWLANAGNPTLFWEENKMWEIQVSESIIKWSKDKYFFVKIEGTSMNEFELKWKKMKNWSYVLVDTSDKSINSYDAFLIILNWFATVKKIKKEWENIYLLPVSSDAAHSPIIVNRDDNVLINWKVIDIFNI